MTFPVVSLLANSRTCMASRMTRDSAVCPLRNLEHVGPRCECCTNSFGNFANTESKLLGEMPSFSGPRFATRLVCFCRPWWGSHAGSGTFLHESYILRRGDALAEIMHRWLRPRQTTRIRPAAWPLAYQCTETEQWPYFKSKPSLNMLWVSQSMSTESCNSSATSAITAAGSHR